MFSEIYINFYVKLMFVYYSTRCMWLSARFYFACSSRTSFNCSRSSFAGWDHWNSFKNKHQFDIKIYINFTKQILLNTKFLSLWEFVYKMCIKSMPTLMWTEKSEKFHEKSDDEKYFFLFHFHTFYSIWRNSKNCAAIYESLINVDYLDTYFITYVGLLVHKKIWTCFFEFSKTLIENISSLDSTYDI